MTLLFTFQSESPLESLEQNIKFNKKEIKQALESQLTEIQYSKVLGVSFKASEK